MIRGPQFNAGHDHTHNRIGQISRSKVHHDNSVETTGRKASHQECKITFQAVKFVRRDTFNRALAFRRTQIPSVTINRSDTACVKGEEVSLYVGWSDVLSDSLNINTPGLR